MTWPSGDPNQPPHLPPPPPMPYGQAQYGQGHYGQGHYSQPGQPAPPAQPYPVPRKSRKGLLIALAAVFVIVVVGIIAVVTVAYFAMKDKVVATDLAPGECITDIPDGNLVALVPKVDCAEPHSGEVFAVLDMPDGDFPGSLVITEWQNKCPAELPSYSAAANEDESINVFVLYPTAETWSRGDHAITCIVTTDDKRSGSVRG